MTCFQLFGVIRDGCHMWGRICSLFPEHLILLHLPLGISCNPFIIHVYALYITEFVSFMTMFTD